MDAIINNHINVTFNDSMDAAFNVSMNESLINHINVTFNNHMKAASVLSAYCSSNILRFLGIAGSQESSPSNFVLDLMEEENAV